MTPTTKGKCSSLSVIFHMYGTVETVYKLVMMGKYVTWQAFLGLLSSGGPPNIAGRSKQWTPGRGWLDITESPVQLKAPIGFSVSGGLLLEVHLGEKDQRMRKIVLTDWGGAVGRASLPVRTFALTMIHLDLREANEPR